LIQEIVDYSISDIELGPVIDVPSTCGVGAKETTISAHNPHCSWRYCALGAVVLDVIRAYLHHFGRGAGGAT
jgi:hypothetical protein